MATYDLSVSDATIGSESQTPQKAALEITVIDSAAAPSETIAEVQTIPASDLGLGYEIVCAQWDHRLSANDSGIGIEGAIVLKAGLDPRAGLIMLGQTNGWIPQASYPIWTYDLGHPTELISLTINGAPPAFHCP